MRKTILTALTLVAATAFGVNLYRSFDDFIPSVRYMSFRRGIYDVKYISRLRAVAGDRPEVKTFLEAAAKRVVVTEKHDRTAADRVREEAAELILKYGRR